MIVPKFKFSFDETYTLPDSAFNNPGVLTTKVFVEELPIDDVLFVINLISPPATIEAFVGLFCTIFPSAFKFTEFIALIKPKFKPPSIFST